MRFFNNSKYLLLENSYNKSLQFFNHPKFLIFCEGCEASVGTVYPYLCKKEQSCFFISTNITRMRAREIDRERAMCPMYVLINHATRDSSVRDELHPPFLRCFLYMYRKVPETSSSLRYTGEKKRKGIKTLCR